MPSRTAKVLQQRVYVLLLLPLLAASTYIGSLFAKEAWMGWSGVDSLGRGGSQEVGGKLGLLSPSE